MPRKPPLHTAELQFYLRGFGAAAAVTVVLNWPSLLRKWCDGWARDHDPRMWWKRNPRENRSGVLRLAAGAWRCEKRTLRALSTELPGLTLAQALLRRRERARRGVRIAS